MIFHKLCQIVIHTCMQTTLVYFINIMEVENVSSEEFADVCESFVDNKLSIHFGEDKTCIQ